MNLSEKKKLRAMGSNVLILPLNEIENDIWVGVVHTIGYSVPMQHFIGYLEGECNVIYSEEDSVSFNYQGKDFISIPHYKIHSIILKEEKFEPMIFEGMTI